VGIAGTPVFVPCIEDHLRLLCFHFLRHGAVRFSRLCDIALMLERRTPDFDWGRLLGSDPIRDNWVRTTLGLAHRFAGARIDDTPVAGADVNLPGWLVEAAARQLPQQQDDPGNSFIQLASRPTDLVSILRRRWPDPVQATLRYPARFDSASRLRLQVAVYLRQIAGFVRHRLAPQVQDVLRQRRGA
jgi:hypothetical protein